MSEALCMCGEYCRPGSDPAVLWLKPICPSTVDSLSRPRLSRIIAYLKLKIWSLFKHENLTTGNKKLWKREEIAPKEQFLLFSTIISIYFQLQESNYIYTCKIWLFDLFFLNSANLICRSTDISKYFRESLRIRDTESRLYIG